MLTFKQKSAQFSKPKHEVLKLEDIDFTTIYAFTLSPIDQPIYFSDYDIHLQDWIESQEYHLVACRYFDCLLNLEVASRFHFHGLIKIDNPAKFYIYDLPKLKKTYTVTIKPIGCMDTWIEYMEKQKSIIEPFCKEHNCKYQIGTLDY